MGPLLLSAPRVLKRALLASRAHVTFTLDLAVWWEIRGRVVKRESYRKQAAYLLPLREGQGGQGEEQCRAS